MRNEAGSNSTKVGINLIGPGAIGVSLATILSARPSSSNAYTVNLIGRRSEVPVRYKNYTVVFEQEPPRQITLPIHSRVPASDDASEWVLLVTKAYNVSDVISHYVEYSEYPKSLPLKVVVLCNGMGVVDKVRSFLPQAIILRGLVHFGAKRNSIDTISVFGAPRIVLASEKVDSNEVNLLADIFKGVGMEVSIENSIRSAEWKKAVVNTVVNSIATMLSINNEGILAPSVIPRLTLPAFQEVVSVMSADGVPTGEVTWETFVQQVSSFGKNINSTLTDYREERPTELDFFLGEVLRRAERFRIETPVLRQIFDELKKMKVIF
jgi:2-dehydropantoate 2-reductase